MFRPMYLKIFLLVFAFAVDGRSDGLSLSKEGEEYLQPSLEVLMHLPPEFEDVDSFVSYMRKVASGQSVENDGKRRKKRELESQESSLKEPVQGEHDVLEPPPIQAALIDEMNNPLAVPMLGVQEGIMRSLYSPFVAKSVNDDEDRVQRDKRTFMDGSGGERETTTTPPYWKRKKENPPFVTGRDGPTQKVSNYQPAQHRAIDNARESHSLKDLEKTPTSNEIGRNNQDSFFASTNRRTYNSRQAENYTPRTPKSVYDTIDYTSRRKAQDSRAGFGRNFDSKPQTPEKSNPEQFARQYTFPRPYDRPYYPFQGDVIGRGVEYYHRTVDPASGRIIYYANMPDPSRHYDPAFSYDPSGRSIYVNGRTYLYDPYGRSYINPIDYRFPSFYGRSSDYLRNGRSSSDFYYYGADKSQKNSRFNGIVDRSKDDFRNRTYIIFDAEESAPGRRMQPFLPMDYNMRYPVQPYGPQFSPSIIPPVSYPDYYRNQFYPTVQSPLPWATGKPFSAATTVSYVTRPFNSPQVQLPLTTRNRNIYPLGDYDKMKKT